MTVMYINPSPHYGMRQSMLKTDYLFECGCGMCQSQAAEHFGGSNNNSKNAAITANGEQDTSATADSSVSTSNNEDDEQDVIALALKAPPGATVDESYASKMKSTPNGAYTNGPSNGEGDKQASQGEDTAETATSPPVKLSAATIKKKKKKAAARLKQEQEAAEAAAKAHALDPMGFFKNDKPSTPWYEEDDI